MRAQKIRDKHNDRNQNELAETRHEESVNLAKKGISVTKKWAIIAIIAGAIIGALLWVF